MKKAVKGTVEESQAHHSRNSATRISIDAIGRDLKRHSLSPTSHQKGRGCGLIFENFLKIKERIINRGI